MKTVLSKIIIIFIIILIIISKPFNLPNSQDNLLTELGYDETDIESQLIIAIVKEHLIPKPFYYQIKDKKSFKEEYLPLYYDKYLAGYSIIQSLNLVNHPNFLSIIRPTEKALFNGDIILVNRVYFFTSADLPKPLIPINNVPLIKRPNETMTIKPHVLASYQALYEAIKRQSLELIVFSAYRSYEKQLSLWQESFIGQTMYLAKPGHSEHQTGLALDLSTLESGLSMAFERTDVFSFLAQHAHEYGFILRYPEGKAHITGYAYEPWHYRFVGIKVAKIIFEEKITLEEYLYKYEIIV